MSTGNPNDPYAAGEQGSWDGIYPAYPSYTPADSQAAYPSYGGSAWPGDAPTAATDYAPTAGYAPTPGDAARDPYLTPDPYAVPTGASTPAPVVGQYPGGQPGAGYGVGAYGPGGAMTWEQVALVQRATSQNALGGWALGVGIAGLFLFSWIFPPIVAIVLGVMGRRAADRGTATNRSMSTAGLVLGVIGLLLLLGCALLLVVAVYAGVSSDPYSLG